MNTYEFFSAMENVSVTLDKKHTINQGQDILYPVYIVLYAHNSIVGKTIRKLTHQPYSHSAIAFNTDMNNLYSFGNRMISDSNGNSHRKFGAGRESFVKKDGKWNYPESTPYAIYAIWLNMESIAKMKKRIHSIFSKPDEYRFSYDGLIKYYLNISSESNYKMFCSQFVASILALGTPLDKLPSLYSPYELKNIKDVHFIEDGVLGAFSRKKLDEHVNGIIDKIKNNTPMD